MEIPKPAEEDKARFRSLVPDHPLVEVKPMFGNLGAFVNGNMFMGLFGSDIGLKLPADQAQQVAESGGGPFGPAERPMTGYVSLPPTVTEPEARPLVAEALAYISAMPAEAPKQRKK
jgi:TfoX/Sxy family transcriptional regulator of competence genes